MSGRMQDRGLIDLIRSLQSRIDRLEKQFSAVQRTNIRLGNVVVSTDQEFNRISMQNLVSGTLSYIGDPEDAKFSFSGDLVVYNDERDVSPPHPTPVATIATAIVLARVQTFGDVTVDVYFNDGTYVKTVNINDGVALQIEGITVPISKNTRIYAQLVSADEGAHDLSVVVRFGEPTTERTDTV